ncbi:MAG: GNAT family N-acetyltransferase [Chloroflexaceae bacterium]|jgi:hypothetical protein|nr:GNAT family N-acetyltransferase [Chloroflexaceae bacterium]
MSPLPLADPAYRRALGSGLVLRWATSNDVDRICALYGHVFRRSADDAPNPGVMAWTRDMMGGQHPLITPGDFALVEDIDQGTVVAATCLLSQEWDYCGIPFGVGRPEIVASHPDYRERGLIRAIFELIHARSAAKGHMVQAITGIPYYYRQFGYEFALDLGGNRGVYFVSIPALAEGAHEAYSLRQAHESDLPALVQLYERDRSRPTVVSTRVSADYWRWQLGEERPLSDDGYLPWMIVDSTGTAAGYLLTKRVLDGEALAVHAIGTAVGTPLSAVLPGVLRALREKAVTWPKSRVTAPDANRVAFVLGRDHPAYHVLGDHLAPRRFPPYAWYVRVDNLPGFLRHIGPALEKRLAESALSGYSGELRCDFYRGGLKLTWDNGRLTGAEPWRVDHNWGARGQAGFPPLVFLQLLFGHRSLDELRHMFPDVWADDEVRALLEVLFPPQASWVLPLE